MKKIITLLLILLIINISPVIAEVDSNSQANELPSSFSWRDINGIDYSTPIKNQMPAPLCEAYALVAAIETIVQHEVGYKFNIDLSEAHLFFYSGGTCNWGVELVDAVQYLVDYGVPDEGCFPDPHRPQDTPFESLSGWENRTIKIGDWGWVDNDINSIKQALFEYGPLIICMLSRTDFSRYKHGIYTPRGLPKGGHVITIFGYDDNEQCWLIRNSAGENWGEDGWIRVAYDAHSPKHPFFWPFYGGTGILYIDGVYGNFQPDVPQINIEQPQLYHTYFNGREILTIFRNIKFIQKSAPRIIGPLTVKVEASNTNKIEFYLDNKLKYVDEQQPYEWELQTSPGLHTIETIAYNNVNKSKDLIDIYVIR